MTTSKSTPRKATARKAAPRKASALEIPDTAPVPQDHKSPAQREAEGIDTVTVRWDGLEFQVSSDPDSWDFWTITEPLSANNIPQAVLGLLGPQQSARLRLERPVITAAQIRELFDEIVRTIGLGNTGNS